jgi:Xaa-Pro aminopeptidase
VAYVSGFRSSNGTLLVARGAQVLVTDFRYRNQVSEEAPDWSVTEQPTGEKLHVTLGRVLAGSGFKRIGFSSGQVSHALWSKLVEAIGDPEVLKPAANLVGKLRQVKEPGEVETIRRAALLADASMVHAWQSAEVGMTERELRVEVESFMLARGAEKAAFDMIVCAGPNSAKCHARPGERPMQSGDLLTIDLGAMVDGYNSDLTRTIALGKASDAQRRIYDLVYQAEAAGIAALRAGAEGKAVDAAARDLITAAGHGEDFGHGLGHGVGLAIHEDPRLATTSEDTLAAGNVITVEPGIYVAGFGGVRIEDLCLVTDSGCELLSHAPKPAELMVV